MGEAKHSLLMKRNVKSAARATEQAQLNSPEHTEHAGSLRETYPALEGLKGNLEGLREKFKC